MALARRSELDAFALLSEREANSTRWADSILSAVRRTPLFRVKRNTSVRLGVTLIEALFVISVLSLLSLIALPAIQTARERSRRSTCQDHLRLLGQALESYHQTHELYPPAAIWKVPEKYIGEIHTEHYDVTQPDITLLYPGTGKELTYANWILMLLPHLGEEALAETFDESVPISDPRNSAVRTTTFPRMNCPSDTYNHSQNHYARPSPNGAYARGNYAINGGVARHEKASPGFPSHPCPTCYHYTYDPKTHEFQWWGDGVGGINKRFSRKDFVNGVSRIVALDELRAGIHPVDSRGVWALGQIGGSITWAHGVHGDARLPNATHTRSDDVVGCGRLHELLGAETVSQKGMPCCWYCEPNYQAAARSMHPGGVNVLLLDGAAGFVPDDVDANVWHALHSRYIRGKIPIPFSRSEEADAAEEPPGLLIRSAAVIDRTEGPTIANSIGMSFTLLPAGEFTMGLPDAGNETNYAEFADEVPAHLVRITRPYYLGTFEVTQSQYEAVIGSNPSFHALVIGENARPGAQSTADFPVENVSWHDAAEFCRRLSERAAEQSAGRVYRLPTEAEWEYACRSGKTTPYQYIDYRYIEPDPEDDSGENVSRPIQKSLAVTTVGSYRPNEFGLYDMRGNVFEWTADWFSRDYYRISPRDDPKGPSSGYLRVVRGGDWIYLQPTCKLDLHPVPPVLANPYVGFRVVCEFVSR